MQISEYPEIWLVLTLSFCAAVLELIGTKKRFMVVAFYSISAIILLFSLTHNQTCSDYDGYRGIYAAIYEEEFSLGSLLTLDGLFVTLTALWKIYINADVDIFLAMYQTISLLIMLICIGKFIKKWHNTLLFLCLFGSLQFYHLICCALRQGLSSVLLMLGFLFLYSTHCQIREGHKPTVLRQSFPLVIILLSINAHWSALPIAALTLTTFYCHNEIAKINQVSSLKKSPARRLLTFYIILIVAISSAFFVFITNESVQQKLILYLSEPAIGYGSKIYLTFLLDIFLIFLSIYIKNRNLRRKSKPDPFILLLVIVLSCFAILLKLMAFVGFGVVIRLIIGINLFQIFCLSYLFENLKKMIRIATLILLSIPYTYFIFAASQEEFQQILF